MKQWPDLGENAARLFVFFFVEALAIGAGIVALALAGAGDAWLILWTLLALVVGSFAGSYLLFPRRFVGQPFPPAKHAAPCAAGYHSENIVEMLLWGFTDHSLHHLVHSDPALMAAGAYLRSACAYWETVQELVIWADAQGKVEDLLAAAERANPLMFALHRPYHTQDGEQPVEGGAEVLRLLAGYNLANIRRLLVSGFSPDDLHHLVRYDPALRAMDDEFEPGASAHDMANTFLDWGRTHIAYDAILAAAERANPRRHAAHHPYHERDPVPPAELKAYHVERIDALLQVVFETESLYRFLRARPALRPLWMAISPHDSLPRMAYQALAAAERRVLIDELLLEVQAAYPEAYSRLGPYEEYSLAPAGAPAAETEAVAEPQDGGADEQSDRAGREIDYEPPES